MTTAQPKPAVEVASGVFALVPEGGATNSGFVVSEEGVAVIEGLMTKVQADRLLGEIKHVTNQPIRYLIYTHFHGDHTLGGAYFLPAAVVGHIECRDDVLDKWDAQVARYGGMRPENMAEFKAVKKAPPEIVFKDTLTLHLGSKRIELAYLGRAHSRSDIMVSLPEEKVAFLGDVALNHRFPFFSDSYPQSWVRVLEKYQQMLQDGVMVPGHGPVGDKRFIVEMHDYIKELHKRTHAAYLAGKSAADAAAGMSFPDHASWTGAANFPVAVERMYIEFKGQI